MQQADHIALAGALHARHDDDHREFGLVHTELQGQQLLVQFRFAPVEFLLGQLET